MTCPSILNMAQQTTIAVLMLLLVLYIAGTAESAHHVPKHTTSTEFIKSSCKATRYPTLCIRSLTGYAKTIRQSPRQLVQSALTVSLSRSRSATKFVSKVMQDKGVVMNPRAHQAIKDCVENMGDAVGRLSSSLRELGRSGRGGSPSFAWHMSNVLTWMSAALTDENTCVDGVMASRSINGNLKAAIRGRIVRVARVTSNALALVNKFAETRKVPS